MAGTNSWTGIGRQILDQYLQSEQGGTKGDAGQMGVDVFMNGFEDEFPGDAEDPIAGTYQGYSLEANRASESRPWGQAYGRRPKIHELNQPEAAQILGWRAVDVIGDRDAKENFHRFVGTPAELRQLIQNYQAMRFVTGNRINFELWFEQWEKGFPEFTQNRSDSNYPLTGEKQWNRVKNLETRPRYKEWTTPQQRADFGYRVVEIWLDRSIPGSSVLLTGTDLQLIQHCIQLEYEGGGSQQQSVSSDVIRYSGIPEITLYFKGWDGQKIITGEKSFRYMGYTDNPKMVQEATRLELIRESDIERMGTKIKAVFGTQPPYKWSKGKKQVVYHDWLRGYNLNVFASTHAEGDRMIQNILSLRDLQVDEAFVKYSEAKNPVKAYPPSHDIEVLGEKLKTPERLPVADVTFERATIYLSTLKKTISIA